MLFAPHGELSEDEADPGDETEANASAEDVVDKTENNNKSSNKRQNGKDRKEELSDADASRKLKPGKTEETAATTLTTTTTTTKGTAKAGNGKSVGSSITKEKSGNEKELKSEEKEPKKRRESRPDFVVKMEKVEEVSMEAGIDCLGQFWAMTDAHPLRLLGSNLDF